MQAVALGDEVALGQLVERHSPRLLGLLRRVLPQLADADDVLQETWVRVARSSSTWDRERLFRPWLFRIATNLARDHARRLRVRARSLPEPAPVEARDPGERLDLERALRDLDPPLREIVALRYFGQLGEADLARALGIPRGTVKSRLHRALRDLRARLEDA